RALDAELVAQIEDPRHAIVDVARRLTDRAVDAHPDELVPVLDIEAQAVPRHRMSSMALRRAGPAIGADIASPRCCFADPAMRHGRVIAPPRDRCGAPAAAPRLPIADMRR